MKHAYKYVYKALAAVAVAFCLSGNSAPAYAAGASIAAVVGEKGVITTADVEARIGLSELSAGQIADESVREKLFPQVLSVLVDEEILRQEAAKNTVSVNPVDLMKALQSLEKQNGLPPGALKAKLAQAGVPPEALERKVEAQILRNILLSRDVRPRISVSDAEITEQMDNIVNKRGYYEVKLSEIVLPVSGSAGRKETEEAAKQLIERIENGAPFDKIASEFSRGPSAEQGGALSWTGIDKLNPILRAVVERMDIGQITNPVMVKNAYHILRLDDKRAMLLNDNDETEIGLRRIFVPLTSDDQAHINEKAAMLGQAAAGYKGGCRGFEKLAAGVGSAISPKMSMIQVKTLDKRLLPLLSNMPLGELSPVTKGDSGMNLFMICERTKARPTPAVREKVKELLEKKKFLSESERYLQELRASYYVDFKS